MTVKRFNMPHSTGEGLTVVWASAYDAVYAQLTEAYKSVAVYRDALTVAHKRRAAADVARIEELEAVLRKVQIALHPSLEIAQRVNDVLNRSENMPMTTTDDQLKALQAATVKVMDNERAQVDALLAKQKKLIDQLDCARAILRDVTFLMRDDKETVAKIEEFLRVPVP